MNICFIGGGNMASALIGGLLNKGFSPDQISVVEINPKSRDRLQADFSIRVADNFIDGSKNSDVIVLAVKPQQLCELMQQIAPSLKGQLLVSVAAGVRAVDLARWANSENIVRAMPNTPALIGSGMTGLYALPTVAEAQRTQAQDILAAVGETLWLKDEAMIDALTAISGSGPAYVFYLIEALQRAATEFGFDADEARRLSLATFVGASKLAACSDEEVSVLRERVTSKNGTTASGLQSLAENHVAKHVVAAAQAAATRSREMGDELGQQ